MFCGVRIVSHEAVDHCQTSVRESAERANLFPLPAKSTESEC